jgi:phosphatidylserine/phosphatidylglycerophosphate/cardiolipin synthase-like enzyme
VRNRALAQELAPLLEGAKLYRTRVHQDTDLVDVVLTKPPAPSQVSAQLESMLQGSRGYRDTRQLLPAIAELARRSFGVMTPFFDEVGAQVVLNLFERTPAADRYLVLRTTKEGAPPAALAAVREDLSRLGVAVLNFRLDRSDAPGNETFHAKVVLADAAAAYVGSSNMNQWSFEYSLELGLYVRGRAAARIAAVLRAVRAVSGPMG